MVKLSLWPKRETLLDETTFHTLCPIFRTKRGSGDHRTGGQGLWGAGGAVMDTQGGTRRLLVITGSFTLVFSAGLDLGQLSSSMSFPLSHRVDIFGTFFISHVPNFINLDIVFSFNFPG